VPFLVSYDSKHATGQMLHVNCVVEEVYGKIPEEKRKAIDKRDGKTDKSIG
jgi:hypothetical protein